MVCHGTTCKDTEKLQKEQVPMRVQDGARAGERAREIAFTKAGKEMDSQRPHNPGQWPPRQQQPQWQPPQQRDPRDGRQPQPGQWPAQPHYLNQPGRDPYPARQWQQAAPERHYPQPQYSQVVPYAHPQYPQPVAVAPKSPAAGLLCGLLLPGLGCMVNGRGGLGAAILACWLVSLVLVLFLVGWILAPACWIWSGIAGYKTAQSWNRAHGIIS